MADFSTFHLILYILDVVKDEKNVGIGQALNFSWSTIFGKYLGYWTED